MKEGNRKGRRPAEALRVTSYAVFNADAAEVDGVSALKLNHATDAITPSSSLLYFARGLAHVETP